MAPRVLAVDGPVAEVRIDRDERHNSLVPALLDDLDERLRAVEAADAVDAVVLTTAGGSRSTRGPRARFQLRTFLGQIE